MVHDTEHVRVAAHHGLAAGISEVGWYIVVHSIGEEIDPRVALYQVLQILDSGVEWFGIRYCVSGYLFGPFLLDAVVFREPETWSGISLRCLVYITRSEVVCLDIPLCPMETWDLRSAHSIPNT